LHIYFAFLQPFYSFVDDLTYISAAFRMIEHFQCPPVAGNVCNYEHPPLSKLLMALGFEIFGKYSTVGSAAGTTANQFGGRFFQMLMGSFSAPVVYLIVSKVTGNWKTSFLAAVFMLVDPLYFTLASTAILDDAMAFFALLAILTYF